MAAGRLEVIAGGMFSGKTEEALRLLKRAIIAKQKVVCFKPATDTRTRGTIESRNGDSYEAFIFNEPHEILEHVTADIHLVVIDEAQFVPREIIHVVTGLVSRGKRVIVAGLDTDSRGMPWETTALLMAIADDVKKVYAVCKVCGDERATRSQKLVDGGERVQIGDEDIYEARCRNCHVPG